MRIAVVSDHENIGGAAKMACLYADAWRISGHEAQMLVGARSCSGNTVSYGVTRGLGIFDRLGMTSARPVRSLYRKLREDRLMALLKRCRPDVICVHDIHHFPLSPDIALRLQEIAPVVWVLHNMWPFTGGCAFSHDCDLYLSECREPCPRKYCRPAADVHDVRARWRRQNAVLKALPGSRVYGVSPSKWLQDCASKAGWPEENLRLIPNGIDADSFSPLNHAYARDALKIPREAKCIMFAAVSPESDTRKGYAFLREALEKVSKRLPVFSLVVGSDREERGETRLVLPYQRSELLMRLFYGSADCFVLPSLAENCPVVLLEALAMGLPCVTFEVGGNPEIVRNGETGFTAKYRDVDDLAACIEKVLALPDEQMSKMRENCRKTAEKEYSLEKQANKYLDLFDSLIDQ